MTVKDNSFFGGGIFLGEALLKLEDIPLSQIDQNLSELPQIQLPLTKPCYQGIISYNTISLIFSGTLAANGLIFKYIL